MFYLYYYSIHTYEDFVLFNVRNKYEVVIKSTVFIFLCFLEIFAAGIKSEWVGRIQVKPKKSIEILAEIQTINMKLLCAKRIDDFQSHLLATNFINFLKFQE